MANLFLRNSGPSSPREQLAFDQVKPSSAGAIANRVDSEAAKGFAPNPGETGVGRLCLRVSRWRGDRTADALEDCGIPD